MRPSFVTKEDIERWDKGISEDKYLPEGFGQNPKEREVLYAGAWLHEQLVELDCSDADIEKIQYIAGSLSVHNDPWEVSQQALNIYQKALDELTSQLTVSELDDYDNQYDDEDLN